MLVLKLLRVLLNVVFKVFNKKVSLYRQNCQLLEAVLRSPPERTIEHKILHLDYGSANHLEENKCSIPYLQPGPCPNYG